MTKRQRFLLISLWNKACQAQGWNPKDAERRHELYCEVLGAPKRFSQFRNRLQEQLGAYLDHPEAYVAEIARDRFHITPGLSTVESLSEAQLGQLIITLAARLQKRRATPAGLRQEAEAASDFRSDSLMSKTVL